MMSSSTTAAAAATASISSAPSLSLAQFAAASLFLSASSCVASVRNGDTQRPAPELQIDDEATAQRVTVLTAVVLPLADTVEHLLRHRQMFILHRFPRQAPASDHSLRFFDAHTLKPVRREKACPLLENLTCLSDSCYLPHAFGRNKPALVVATSIVCDARTTFGWAPTIFVLDEHFNCIKPPPSLAANQAPDVACSVCPHPSEPSVVLCASESNNCVMCLNIAKPAQWYRFGGSSLSDFCAMDAIVALPSCGLLAFGSYASDRLAVCDLNNPVSGYEEVSCDVDDSTNDVCSTGFAALGDRYFVCMVSWGLGVYDAVKREQIGFFPLNHDNTTSCDCGGIVKALEVPKDQQSTTLGLFIVFHRDLLQIVRCDHQLQWSAVNDVDGGPLLEALRSDGSDVNFFALV